MCKFMLPPFFQVWSFKFQLHSSSNQACLLPISVFSSKASCARTGQQNLSGFMLGLDFAWKVPEPSALATGLLEAWAEQGMAATTVQSLAAKATKNWVLVL